ncbi:MAG: hydroxymethylglutaryl-CoA lyase [Ferruginibacter sp.]
MLPKNKISLIECPRDAMQGWKHFIPTQKKISYINALLKVGFDTIDFGSFVSPKAIPQMADTKEVVRGLHVDPRKTKLLAIVANLRGAEEALVFDEISYLGFPFSISPTFQLRNTNRSMEASLEMVEEINNLCINNQKELVIYISMGFGNPYGDPYNQSTVMEWVNEMVEMDIDIISIADTVGLATPEQVGYILTDLISSYPDTKIGVHLHSPAAAWQARTDAALKAGCTRFDGALKGIGGCPFAGDELVGNMDTELMIPYFNELNLLNNVDLNALRECSRMAGEIFNPGPL